MITSEEGLRAIMEHEGVRLTAYPDPGTGGDPWTIGVGHTGPEVVHGMTITREEAMSLLAQDVKTAEKCVTANVRVGLTQSQFDALVSFVFNVGCGAFKGSTLLKKLNADDEQGAADEFLRWNKAAGRVLPGLTARREAEREMFLA
jgi:lysozyme